MITMLHGRPHHQLASVKNLRYVWVLVSALCILLLLMSSLESGVDDDSSDDSVIAQPGSCRKKVSRALDRAKRINDKYRAFIELTPLDLALKRADVLDRVEPGSRGKLHCMLVAIKDNIETCTDKWGLRTTAGSAALLALLPARERIRGSAPSVVKLENEGVVIVGKTNMDDFALQYHSFSTRAGQTLNCHDSGRYPGGSSGGSAVAVSLGVVDFALGTDTGGSIRIPASFAGIVGLRPSQDSSISTEGVIPLSVSRDTVGPMARDVATAQRVFEILRGGSSECDVQKQSKVLKVAIMRDLFTDELWQGLQPAIQVLQSHLGGIEVLTDVPESLTRSRLLKQTKSASMFEFKRDLESYLLKNRKISVTLENLLDKTRELCSSCELVIDAIDKKVKTAGSVPASVTASWRNTRADLVAYLKANDFQAVVFPAFTALPTRLKLNKKQDFCPNNRLAAITGLPSLVVFGGKIKSLPVGLEFVGLDECELFQLGKVFEQRFNKRGNCVT